MKKRKLSVRMTAYCLVFAVLLSALIGGIGFYTYFSRSIGHFEDYIEAILAIASEGIDAEALEANIRTGRQDEPFEKLQQKFNVVKQNSEIQYIYLISKKETGYIYVLCGYDREELEAGDSYKELGERVTESDIEPDMQKNFDRCLEGTLENRYIPNTSDLGYVMTGILPVVTADGEITAMMGVDIPMETIRNDLMNFVTGVLLGTGLSVAVFSFFFVAVIRKKILSPILEIGRHVDGFVKQTEGRPSDRKVQELVLATGDELEQLAGQMNGMMRDMVTYMGELESTAATQERMNVQMSVASRIQQNILPATFPAFPERTEFTVYGVMRPAGEVGGDFYDFFMIDGTHLGMVVADVSGEGIPSALFMMMTRTLIKNYACLGLEPAKVLYETNRELCQGNPEGMTVEVFIGILDVYYGDFLYAAAGVNTPFLRTTKKEWRTIETAPGFRLGMLEKVSFEQGRSQVREGELLVLYTSGVSRNGFELQTVLKEMTEAEEMAEAEEIALFLPNVLNRTAERAEKIRTEKKSENDITMLSVKRYHGCL